MSGTKEFTKMTDFIQQQSHAHLHHSSNAEKFWEYDSVLVDKKIIETSN